MAVPERAKFVEVYEFRPGQGRPNFAWDPHGALTFLPADAPLPHPGDIILLTPSATGDSEKAAFLMGGAGAPFRVLEVEHLYGNVDEHNPSVPEPAPYVKSWIHVVRLTEDEYEADPSWKA